MKASQLLVTLVISILAFEPAQALNSQSPQQRKAQKALAAQDYEKAFSLYVKIAEDTQDAQAQFTVGLFYHLGWGRPVDPIKASPWLEKAAAGGVPLAHHFLGDYLVAGINGEPNPAKAVVHYEKAAELGYHASLCALAELYMTGAGVKKNPQKAMTLCQQAAEKGGALAQVRLGRFFLEGEKSIQDHTKAFQCLESAAQRNNPEAMYYLGVMYRDGLGCQKDPLIGRHWFETAASKKYAPAYLPTGQLYVKAPVDPDTGKLTAEDLAKAYLWLSAASREAKQEKDKKTVNALLEEVNSIMPKTWKAELDAKVDAHFSEKQQSAD